MSRVQSKINTFWMPIFCCFLHPKFMMAKKKQNGPLFVIIAVFTVLLLVASFFILSAMGERSGVEFSPDDFTMRRFTYCRLPLINWTKRGIEYDAVPTESFQVLIDDDWIRASGRTPKRWHLVRATSGFDSSTGGKNSPPECDARFLTKYLELTNTDGENYIMKWTDDHPKAAKVFWPLIAELARDNLYLPIPQLMEFAIEFPKMDDTERFNSEFEQLVANAWFEAAKTDQLNGRHERAIKRFDVAIKIGGDHPEAEQLKVKSSTDVYNGDDQTP
jgi:hypothetical protein